MSHASASGDSPPDILRSSAGDQLLLLFSRHHHTRARFPTDTELVDSFRRFKKLYEERGKPATLKQKMPAMDGLFDKRHQLSPRNRERVKAAFDTAALLLECRAPYNDAALILRANRIIGTSKGAIPPVSDAIFLFLRELHSVLPDALRGDPNAPDSLAKLDEKDSPAQLALNQLDRPALDALKQLMAYLAMAKASRNPHAPSTADLLTARQALELASLGGEYLEIVELSGRNSVLCQELTFVRFLGLPLFLGHAIKEVFAGWVAHGFPNRFSTGILMIEAIRKVMHERLHTAIEIFPKGRIPEPIHDFFAKQRTDTDNYFMNRSTLNAGEMAPLLRKCNALEQVKWFIAEKIGEQSLITVEDLVRLPSPDLFFEYR
ncbi:hypothetical protein NBRC10513v2_006208 [Rhodotorula toruloides]